MLVINSIFVFKKFTSMLFYSDVLAIYTIFIQKTEHADVCFYILCSCVLYFVYMSSCKAWRWHSGLLLPLNYPESFLWRTRDEKVTTHLCELSLPLKINSQVGVNWNTVVAKDTVSEVICFDSEESL